MKSIIIFMKIQMFNKMILNYNPKNLLKEGGIIFMKKKTLYSTNPRFELIGIEFQKTLDTLNNFVRVHQLVFVSILEYDSRIDLI